MSLSFPEKFQRALKKELISQIAPDLVRNIGSGIGEIQRTIGDKTSRSRHFWIGPRRKLTDWEEFLEGSRAGLDPWLSAAQSNAIQSQFINHFVPPESYIGQGRAMPMYSPQEMMMPAAPVSGGRLLGKRAYSKL